MKILFMTSVALITPKPAKRCIRTGRLAEGCVVNRL
jgi:hypothetical protein